MADSAAIALVVGDWVAVPTVAQFTIQNTCPFTLPVKVAAVKPTSFAGAKYMEGWHSMSKLGGETHWIYTDHPGSSASFTENDLT